MFRLEQLLGAKDRGLCTRINKEEAVGLGHPEGLVGFLLLDDGLFPPDIPL